MLESLYSAKRSVLAHHQMAPRFADRERFLEHCASRGYSQRTLKKIAWILLYVVEDISIRKRYVSSEEIRCAAEDWGKTFGRRRKHASSSKKVYVKYATDWFRFLDCLKQTSSGCKPFTREIAEFGRFMREERGLSPVTVEQRCRRANSFFEALHPRVRSLKKISITDTDTFLAEKGNASCSRKSVSALASDLRSFFRYAEAKKWCASGIAAAIESPRIFEQEGIQIGPNWHDVQRLIDSTEGDLRTDIRDRAIVMIFASYGLRNSEVSKLRIDDIDWENEVLCITRPKQRCVQQYPLTAYVGEAILRYLREVRPQCAYRELFLTMKAPIHPLSRGALYRAVSSRLIALGVDAEKYGPYCLRHACAGRLLDSGFSYKQIGDYLGHRNTESTRSYVKINLAKLRQVAEIDLGRLL